MSPAKDDVSDATYQRYQLRVSQPFPQFVRSLSAGTLAALQHSSPLHLALWFKACRYSRVGTHSKLYALDREWAEKKFHTLAERMQRKVGAGMEKDMGVYLDNKILHSARALVQRPGITTSPNNTIHFTGDKSQHQLATLVTSDNVQHKFYTPDRKGEKNAENIFTGVNWSIDGTMVGTKPVPLLLLSYIPPFFPNYRLCCLDDVQLYHFNIKDLGNAKNNKPQAMDFVFKVTDTTAAGQTVEDYIVLPASVFSSNDFSNKSQDRSMGNYCTNRYLAIRIELPANRHVYMVIATGDILRKESDYTRQKKLAASKVSLLEGGGNSKKLHRHIALGCDSTTSFAVVTPQENAGMQVELLGAAVFALHKDTSAVLERDEGGEHHIGLTAGIRSRLTEHGQPTMRYVHCPNGQDGESKRGVKEGDTMHLTLISPDVDKSSTALADASSASSLPASSRQAKGKAKSKAAAKHQPLPAASQVEMYRVEATNPYPHLENGNQLRDEVLDIINLPRHELDQLLGRGIAALTIAPAPAQPLAANGHALKLESGVAASITQPPAPASKKRKLDADREDSAKSKQPRSKPTQAPRRKPSTTSSGSSSRAVSFQDSSMSMEIRKQVVVAQAFTVKQEPGLAAPSAVPLDHPSQAAHADVKVKQEPLAAPVIKQEAKKMSVVNPAPEDEPADHTLGFMKREDEECAASKVEGDESGTKSKDSDIDDLDSLLPLKSSISSRSSSSARYSEWGSGLVMDHIEDYQTCDCTVSPFKPNDDPTCGGFFAVIAFNPDPYQHPWEASLSKAVSRSSSCLPSPLTQGSVFEKAFESFDHSFPPFRQPQDHGHPAEADSSRHETLQSPVGAAYSCEELVALLHPHMADQKQVDVTGFLD